MPRMWPNTFVEPANLKIQIAVGGDSEVNRFRIKIPGRSSIASLPITMSDQFEPFGALRFAEPPRTARS
jgi:hypothetical protein